MEKVTKDSPEAKSADLVTENIKQLKKLFPEAFSEDGINFDTLRQLLGDADVLDKGEEKYGLNWHGKKQARQIALTPSMGTLLPCPEESVDWDTTQNLFIEGDNLEVLKLLQKSYAGKVKMIYIDPPYNTGKEFIYPDKFQDNLDTYLKYTGQVNNEGMKFSSNTETSGRKHTNWLNMMYPRLKLARNLLKQDGVIFISIDDHEQAHLKAICDDIFGEENFVAMFSWEKRTNRENRKVVSYRHEHIACYSKNFLGEDTFKKLPMTEKALSNYKNIDNDPKGLWKSDPATAQAGHGTKKQFYVLEAPNGKKHHLQSGRCWLYTKEVMEEKIKQNEIWFGKNGNSVPRIKTYFNAKERGLTPESIWFANDVSTTEKAKNSLKKLFNGIAIFDTPKPIDLISRMLQLMPRSGYILDFFAGTSPTAHAVLQKNLIDDKNNKFIMVQLPERCEEKSEAYKAGYKTIADIGKERIRRAANKIKQENPDYQGDLGFKVFKLASSNIKAWNPDKANLEQTLLDHQDHLIAGRSEQDVLYELLLKRGIDLTIPIEERQINGKTLYSIGYGALFACLDNSLTCEDIEAVAQGILHWKETLNPATEPHVFFRDSAFADDIAKTNLVAILEQGGIQHVRSL